MSNMPVIEAHDLSVTAGGKLLLQDLSFTIRPHECWAITGASGTGKTTLLKVLGGMQHFRGKLLIDGKENSSAGVVFVEQQHHFKSLSNVSNFYYQQRFNSMDAEDAITVYEDLKNHIEDEEALYRVAELFHLKGLLEERLIQLSNGENKRLQLAKALLDQPGILLLDNPFTGLDTKSRALLDELLSGILSDGVQIILVCSPRHIPSFVTHVLSLNVGGSYSIAEADRYSAGDEDARNTSQFDRALFHELIAADQHTDFEFAVKLHDVHISYHNRKILDQVNWIVRRGECWSLSGPNGAGKSTLLSLITADNPQAYANNIYLFDRKRGTGETIWEIKKKIGYISPELHLHFAHGDNCFEVVASGLFDTIGLFRALNDDQVALVNKWMRLLQVDKLQQKMLFQLSNSEQRMVLLARALVKNPPMLVLDEPCQGLDDQQVSAFRELINQICIQGHKTLIYVSHYTEEIPSCVNKFLKLENGRVVNYEL